MIVICAKRDNQNHKDKNKDTKYILMPKGSVGLPEPRTFFLALIKKRFPLVIQYTPDNSNLQGTDENGSS